MRCQAPRPVRPLLVAVFAAVLTPAAPAAEKDEHPFILWTRDEAAATRRTVEREDWAERAYAAAQGERHRGDSLFALFRFSVMGDREAGEAEKKVLLDSTRGKASGKYITALRYDCLYPLLSAGERRQVERSFREYVEMGMTSMKDRHYNRFNWLPNLGYPWYISAHLMAASMRDRELMREIFEGPNGLKWYLDEYLSDSGFYNEEFGKMYNTPDGILLWCRACKRLGMDEMGFGYRGRQGATVRGHIESVLRIGMPRVDLGTSRPHYPRMSMGDAKGARGFPAYGFQHYNVAGWLTHREGGRPYDRWSLGEWCWFELAHQEWPDAGFDYFLAARRAPDEDRYYPSLLFGLEPIDPKKTSPPSAPSGVYPGRGIVVLRAEEGPEYWKSPAPAVGMRLATPYAHHVQDCFSLTGFYAFNRPIYVNRKHASNYSGVDPGFSNSARSHSTVIVDFAEPKTIGEVPVRHRFEGPFKYVEATAEGIYDGVKQSRALVLTDDYLFDAFRLESDRPRHYQWHLHAVGHVFPQKPGGWTASRDLVGSQFDCGNERSLATDNDWSVEIVQSSGGANRRFSGLGDRWFEQRIGSRVTMLAAPQTTAYHARAPVVWESPGQWRGRDRFCHGEDEPAAALVSAVRKCGKTTFIAVHEPFRDELPQRARAEKGGKATHRRIYVHRMPGPDDDTFCVSVSVLDYDADGDSDRVYEDYIMRRYGADPKEHVTVGRGGVQFRFGEFAFIRETTTKIDAYGELSGIKTFEHVDGRKLVLNGRPTPMRRVGSNLIWGELEDPPPPKGPGRTAMAIPRATTVAARWIPQSSLCLPTGGSAKRELRIRNIDTQPATGVIRLQSTGGLRIEPAKIGLAKLAAGGEKDFTVSVAGSAQSRNRLSELYLFGETKDPLYERDGFTYVDSDAEPGLIVGRTPLRVAHGVCSKRSQRWPADFAETIYSPRYVAKVYYMDMGAAALLLDPEGFRRTTLEHDSYPQLVKHGTDDRGREGWHADDVPNFPYFITVVVPGRGDEPAHLYEAGEHAHGRTSSVEHWFHEEWIVVRYRRAEPGERIAFDWLPQGRWGMDETIFGRDPALAEEKMPGKLLVAAPDGKLHDAGRPDDWPRRADLPREVEEIAAVFLRPHGYEYGSAMLYPRGAKREGSYVTQPGELPMGFTFCTEEEFSGLVEKWRNNPPPSEASEEERRIYGAAFMPHSEEPTGF